MIINQANLVSLTTAFKTSFQEGFNSYQPRYQQVATTVPSTTGQESYNWLGQWPKIREWIGDRQVQNLKQFGYTIKNKDFETTVAVPRNDIEDDQYGTYTPLMRELGFAAKVHPDELVFALLAAGFSEKCFDGQYFFDSDHPLGDGTVSNVQAGSGPAWFLLDTTRSLKPLIFQERKKYKFTPLVREEDPNVFWKKEYVYGADGRSNVGFGFWQMAFGSKLGLDKTNFAAAKAAMTALKSDQGRPLGIRPSLLVVGPSLEQAALDLIKAERTANGATNTLFNSVDIEVSPYLP
jgi:phage major head subunit gpT-like protein